jgi:hypothetical protein
MYTTKRLILAASMAAMVMFAGPAQASCNDGKDRRVTIINDTNYTIVRLYGSNVGENSWQEDVLGDRVIPPGGKVTVNFDDGTCYCSFDLKAEFSDDTSTVRNGYNVCTMGSWRIHE